MKYNYLAMTTERNPHGDNLVHTRRGILRSFVCVATTLEIGTTVVTAQDAGRQQWAFETGEAVHSSPTVVEETVFVGSNDGYLYAVDVESGNQRWAFETGAAVYSSPTVVGGTVFIGNYDGYLYAVDAESGNQLWTFEISDTVRSSPTVVDNIVFIGGGDGNLYAVDAESGNQQWVFKTGDRIRSSPTVVSGTVFVGSNDGNLYAVDAENGGQQWAFETGDWIRSSPAVVDRVVLIGSLDGNLYAVDAENGSQQWAFETGDWVQSSPTIIDDTVFVGSNDGNLYAVDVENGNQQWTFETGSPVQSSPTALTETVFVGNSDGDLYAVDAESGSQQWVSTIGNTIKSSPTITNSTVFIGSYDRHLYAISTSRGETGVGSRSTLGTLGHNDSWRHSNQTIDIPAHVPYTSWPRNIVGLLGVGSILTASGYYVVQRRRRTTFDRDRSTSPDSAETNLGHSKVESEEDGEQDEEATPRNNATDAVAAAESAQERGEFEQAVEKYRKALEYYEAAADDISVDDSDSEQEIADAITTTREKLDTVTRLEERQVTLCETLRAGERSFQEAVAAYVKNEYTISRIRFRQARDKFEAAIETVEDTDAALLASEIEIVTEASRQLSSEKLTDIRGIGTEVKALLEETNVETLADLATSDKDSLTPSSVAEPSESNEISDATATKLTVLSWWNQQNKNEFKTIDDIVRRYKQAKYGFSESQ